VNTLVLRAQIPFLTIANDASQTISLNHLLCMNCFYKSCLWKISKYDNGMVSDRLTEPKDSKSFFPVTCHVHRIIGNVDGCTSVMGEKVLILLATYMFKNTSRSGHLILNANFGNEVHFCMVPLSVTALSSAINIFIIYLYLHLHHEIFHYYVLTRGRLTQIFQVLVNAFVEHVNSFFKIQQCDNFPGVVAIYQG
jgi:hypothetical protein